jgi:hypothetical protein
LSLCPSGYGSIAIAEGLNRALGIDIIQVRSGAAPSSILTTIMEMVRNFGPDNNEGFWNVAVLLGAVFSSTNAGVANYDMDQNFLNDNYLYTREWLNEEKVSEFVINERLLTIFIEKELELDDILTEFWNPNLISFLQGAIDAGVDNPCAPSYSGYEVGVNDKFCEAFLQNDLIDVLRNAKYPVNICHSSEDEIVSYENVPDDRLNPKYLTVDTVVGDHNAAGAACTIRDILYLASPEFWFTPEISSKKKKKKTKSKAKCKKKTHKKKHQRKLRL